MARQICDDYRGQPVTIVGVLTGCLMFLADLVRHLDLPLRIALLQASSYRGATTTPGALRVQPELLPDLRGRHVLLIDDILDTGQTLAYLRQHLQSLDLASLRIAVLLRKEGRQQVPIEEPSESRTDISDQRGLFEHLAKLSPVDYERVRVAEAKRLGMRVGALDKAVRQKLNRINGMRKGPLGQGRQQQRAGDGTCNIF